MMCLKPAVPDKEIESHVPKSSDRVQLVLKFSSGCVPLGCFGSTISCLLSQYEWKILHKDGTLILIASNVTTLYVPHLDVRIVLVDLTQRLEVHITSNPSSLDTPIKDIFGQVHMEIHGAIKKVMHLDTECIKISSAVFCSCKQHPEQGVSSRMPRGPGSSLTDSPGLAILVSCDYTSGVDKLEPLPGTNVDAREMKETLDYLGYASHVLHNPTKAQIQAKLQEVSELRGDGGSEKKKVACLYSPATDATRALPRRSMPTMEGFST